MPNQLTAAQCKNHKVGTIHDVGAYKGLRLGPRKTDGPNTWTLRHNADIGEKVVKRQVKLGAFPEMGLKEARERYIELRLAHGQGEALKHVIVKERAQIAEKRAEAEFTVCCVIC